jgi:hypothetical protein
MPGSVDVRDPLDYLEQAEETGNVRVTVRKMKSDNADCERSLANCPNTSMPFQTTGFDMREVIYDKTL